MAFNDAKITVYNDSTPAKGSTFEAEFQRLYDNFVAMQSGGAGIPTIKATGAITSGAGSYLSGSGANSTQNGIGASASAPSATANGRLSVASADSATAEGVAAEATAANAGAFSRLADAGHVGSTAVGNESATTAADQIILGKSTTTAVLGDGTAITSDERDKIDIVDNDMGLEAIKKIRTVKYRANPRDRYYLRDKVTGKLIKTNSGQLQYDEKSHAAGDKKGSRYHRGVVAQEVLEQFDSMDFSAVKSNTVKDDTAFDAMQVNYTQFIPLLIKAVQELSEEVDRLKNA